MLQKNRAVHEPQEEVAFTAVISWLQRDRRTNHTMIELGSYWAFYSLWFKTTFPHATCFCVEPDEINLNWGRKNFELNGQLADFTQAYIGSKPKKGNPPTISVDSFVETRGIEHVDILHSDIQGHELEMLQGSRESIRRHLIDYMFISTHSHSIHYRCLEQLAEYGFRILADADLLESHSLDGLIVAARPDLHCPTRIPIHHRAPK
ncbi:MAG TPA: FkbM family methyltransferase [Terriglobales bacterium]|nr:FkbM family methyltransferase [Terriglobales bacterium]